MPLPVPPLLPVPKKQPVSPLSRKPKMTPRNAPRLPVLMPLLLVLSLSACAPCLPRAPDPLPAQIPPPPVLSEPMPAVSYSLSAQALLQSWRARLTDSTPTD